MENTAVRLKEKYEKKLKNAINKSGGISLTKNKQKLEGIIITEPKGLYAVDNFDLELIELEVIMQEVETGKIMVITEEFGMMDFNFEFVGSEKECYKYLLKENESNAKAITGLHITINGHDENE